MPAAATPEEVWAILREVAAAQKETAQRFQETGLKFKETDRQFKAVMATIGQLGNKHGEFVEELAKPAVMRLFSERGIAVHEVHRGVSAQRDGDWIEVDLLVVNDGDVVAVECKNTLSAADVDEHLERLAKLKRLLPTYRQSRVMGAVAAMVLPDDVARHAYRRGLFVLAQSGDGVVIRNDARFAPATW